MSDFSSTLRASRRLRVIQSHRSPSPVAAATSASTNHSTNKRSIVDTTLLDKEDATATMMNKNSSGSILTNRTASSSMSQEEDEAPATTTATTSSSSKPSSARRTSWTRPQLTTTTTTTATNSNNNKNRPKSPRDLASDKWSKYAQQYREHSKSPAKNRPAYTTNTSTSTNHHERLSAAQAKAQAATNKAAASSSSSSTPTRQRTPSKSPGRVRAAYEAARSGSPLTTAAAANTTTKLTTNDSTKNTADNSKNTAKATKRSHTPVTERRPYSRQVFAAAASPPKEEEEEPEKPTSTAPTSLAQRSFVALKRSPSPSLRTHANKTPQKVALKPIPQSEPKQPLSAFQKARAVAMGNTTGSTEAPQKLSSRTPPRRRKYSSSPQQEPTPHSPVPPATTTVAPASPVVPRSSATQSPVVPRKETTTSPVSSPVPRHSVTQSPVVPRGTRSPVPRATTYSPLPRTATASPVVPRTAAASPVVPRGRTASPVMPRSSNNGNANNNTPEHNNNKTKSNPFDWARNMAAKNNQIISPETTVRSRSLSRPRRPSMGNREPPQPTPVVVDNPAVPAASSDEVSSASDAMLPLEKPGMPVIPSLNHHQPSPAAVSTTAGKETKDTNQKAKTAFEQARARVLAGRDPLARGEDKPLSAFEQARLKAKANCERNNVEVDDSKPLSAFEQARLVAAGNSASKKPIAKTYRSPPRTKVVESSRSPIIPRGISKALQSAPALLTATMETHPSKSSSQEDDDEEAVTSPPVKPPPAANMGGRFSASQAKHRSLMHSPYMPQSVMVSPAAQTPDRKAGRRTADVSTPHGPPPPARTVAPAAAPVPNSKPEHVPRPPVAAAPLSPKNRPMPNWSQGADQSPVVRRPRTPPYEADEPGPVDEVDEMDLQVPEEPAKKTEEVSETEATLLEESESEVPESAQVEVVSHVTEEEEEEVVAAESPRNQVASPRQLEISPRASIEMFQATDTTMEKIEIQNESIQNESNDPVDLSQPELETKQVKKIDRSWNLDRETFSPPNWQPFSERSSKKNSSKKNSLTIEKVDLQDYYDGEEKKAEIPVISSSPNSLQQMAAMSIHAVDFDKAVEDMVMSKSSSGDADSEGFHESVPNNLPEEFSSTLQKKAQGNVTEQDSMFGDPNDFGAVDSSIVFGDPDTFGAAGGGQKVAPPHVADRAKALENWQGGLGVTPPKKHTDTVDPHAMQILSAGDNLIGRFETSKSLEDETNSKPAASKSRGSKSHREEGTREKNGASAVVGFWKSSSGGDDHDDDDDTQAWIDQDPSLHLGGDPPELSSPVQSPLSPSEGYGDEINGLKSWFDASAAVSLHETKPARSGESSSLGSYAKEEPVDPFSFDFTSAFGDVPAKKGAEKSQFDPFWDDADTGDFDFPAGGTNYFSNRKDSFTPKPVEECLQHDSSGFPL